MALKINLQDLKALRALHKVANSSYIDTYHVQKFNRKASAGIKFEATVCLINNKSSCAVGMYSNPHILAKNKSVWQHNKVLASTIYFVYTC